MGRSRVGGVSTDSKNSRSRKKQKQNKRQEGGEAEEEEDALCLRTCHISGFRRGNRGKQDRKERQAFFSRQKNFL